MDLAGVLNWPTLDPLSFTASLIAVTGALSTSGQILEKLLSLRQAPTKLLALINEVNALRSLLRIVQAAVEAVKEQDELKYDLVDLHNLIYPVNRYVQDLDNITQYQFRRSETVNSDGTPKVSRIAWLKGGPDLAALQSNLHDTRLNLIAALSAVNTVSQ